MRRAALIGLLLLASCAGPSGRSADLDAGYEAIRTAYPGDSVWSVSNRQPSGGVVICGYAYRLPPHPYANAFVWMGGKLLSPIKVTHMPETSLTKLCGPIYVAPNRMWLAIS